MILRNIRANSAADSAAIYLVMLRITSSAADTAVIYFAMLRITCVNSAAAFGTAIRRFLIPSAAAAAAVMRMLLILFVTTATAAAAAAIWGPVFVVALP